MAIPLLLIATSMIIIWKASDWFETSSNYLGRNLSDGVKGATINAIGSSMPELITAFIALVFYANKSGFAFGVGTTAGSAVFNVAVIPALVILTVAYFKKKNVVVDTKVILRDGLWLISAELLLIYFLSKGPLDWTDGVTLMAYYIGYMYFLFATMKKSEPVDDEEYDITFPKAIGLLLVSIFFIAVACHVLVTNCYAIGSHLGIGTYFVAVILAAAATSVPDTIISIKDANRGNYNDAVANALGSNIFDITICIGLPLFVYSLATGESIILKSDDGNNLTELRFLLLGLTVFIFLLFLIGKKMGKFKAALMLLGYFGFVGYIVNKAFNLFN